MSSPTQLGVLMPVAWKLILHTSQVDEACSRYSTMHWKWCKQRTTVSALVRAQSQAALS
jgi:hypothetical protein